LKDLGVIYFNEGQYEQAARILEGAAGIISDDPEILFYLGRTQAELGHLLDAAATFEALIAKNYDYPLVFYFLGETYGKLGKLEDAHYNLGIYYEKKGDLKNAAFHLKKALELMEDPNKRDVIEKMLKDVKEKQKEKAKAGQ
jgi:tetratricopeptide (TPR) repeat protein